LREAVGVLLEGAPRDVNLTALRQTLEQIPGVRDVHDLHVWSLRSDYNAMSAHLVLTEEGLLRNVLVAAQRSVKGSFNVQHVTVQCEPDACVGQGVHE
jgi:cobalt-zinc-cadmium efflux system protein